MYIGDGVDSSKGGGSDSICGCEYMYVDGRKRERKNEGGSI